MGIPVKSIDIFLFTKDGCDSCAPVLNSFIELKREFSYINIHTNERWERFSVTAVPTVVIIENDIITHYLIGKLKTDQYRRLIS